MLLAGRRDDPGSLGAGWHGDLPANSDPQSVLQVLPDGAAEAPEAGQQKKRLTSHASRGQNSIMICKYCYYFFSIIIFFYFLLCIFIFNVIHIETNRRIPGTRKNLYYAKAKIKNMKMNLSDLIYSVLFTFSCVVFFFFPQGVMVDEVRPDCLSATEIYHPQTPSSVQVYQVRLTNIRPH